MGALTSSPWIYAVVALSVLLDVFLPLLPSGVLVITAATATAAGSTTVSGAGEGTSGQVPSLIVLILCATTASVLGDLVAYRLAWRGGDRLDRAIARSRRLTTAQERLGAALSRGGGALVVIARFAPAGRSVVSLGAGAARRRVRDFLPWSALAGLAWACYSVGLGYFGGRWLGSTWFGTAVSVLALFMAGALAAFVVKRPTVARATAETGAAGAVKSLTAEGTAPPPSPKAANASKTANAAKAAESPEAVRAPNALAPKATPTAAVPAPPSQVSVPTPASAPAPGPVTVPTQVSAPTPVTP